MTILDQLQEQSVKGPVTKPQFLVRLLFEEPKLYSTRKEIVWNGETYEAGSVKVKKITHSHSEFEILNKDYEYTQGALSGIYLRTPVEIYWAYEGIIRDHYVKPGYWKAGYTKGPGGIKITPIKMFTGIIYGTPKIDYWLSISAHRHAPKLFPNRKLRPPLANHTPSAGYTITFDGQVLNIQGRQR